MHPFSFHLEPYDCGASWHDLDLWVAWHRELKAILGLSQNFK